MTCDGCIANNPSRYPFLLQSTSPGGALGRFDILFAFPGETLELSASGLLHHDRHVTDAPFLPALDNWWSAERRVPGTGALPFRGGWFLYLGYELANEIEPGLSQQRDPVLPVAFATSLPGGPGLRSRGFRLLSCSGRSRKR